MIELRGKIIEARAVAVADPEKDIGRRLKELRKISGITQAEMAERLQVGQASVSKIENRGDIQISTLRSYVEALGASLRIDAAFPDDANLALHLGDAFEIERSSDHQLVLPIFDDEVRPAKRDVVLSIKPQYTDKIIEGKKTVELRRRFPVSMPSGTLAYIYSTSPVRALVAFAEIANVIKSPVREIWDRYASVASIEKLDFDHYFAGRDDGFVLRLSNVRSLARPVPLEELRHRFRFEAPQSYLYADPMLRRALQDEYPSVLD